MNNGYLKIDILKFINRQTLEWGQILWGPDFMGAVLLFFPLFMDIHLLIFEYL